MQDSVCTMGIAMYSVCAVAEVFLALGRDALAKAESAREFLVTARIACKAVRRYAAQTRICRPRAALLAGRLALLEGQGQRAARLFAHSLTEAQRLGMLLEQAEAHRELATVDAADAARDTHTARTAAIMQRLGADPWRYAASGERNNSIRKIEWS
jgi:hypothetical protein